ncbi:tyrosine decarboxylase [Arenimonas maotaiensis]|uniref:Tyrosine decarboxylase n=1 Tax=Arenimonas maotaiensis TaxID=1446479 RepID=A0A917FG44_9GAMM|nr:pyridoxal-dependent decarboxylase [Arenimonas maotaiensis]GGF82146.1 tyrosine decarboxylase [Arenimonas maotaiensis]
MSNASIYPYFLGPYGENNDLLEKLVVEFLRDHVYWRRNLYPDDPPAIPTRASDTPEFMEFEARLRRELHSLSAALKRSVPFHSPRYLGHMVSDVLLPGLAAQFLTLPYNPNNVSVDAAPVTVDLEIKTGLQLARMLGFSTDTTKADCSFGHLTSGGTVANYQALRLAMALKAFPVALLAANPPGLSLPEDDWQAYNLTPDQSIALLSNWHHWLDQQSIADKQHYMRRLHVERIETRGLCDFFTTHLDLVVPSVLAPITAHYSWSKGVKLLGLGRQQLMPVPVRGMRMNCDALHDIIENHLKQQKPILMAVGVLGSTEFGTIDPLHELLRERDWAAKHGIGFSVHVDAAWGGYLATLFRQEDGGIRPREEVCSEFSRFPDTEVYSAFEALGHVDSVTVDPHKLGYIPYGAGAFICRDQRGMELLAEEADYVFSVNKNDDYFKRYRQLGRYIPEGSKSGAIAAAVYVTHSVMPLDHRHFGKLPRESILAAEVFQQAIQDFSRRVSNRLICYVPFEPDSNLVCLALNPVGNRDIATMNNFVRGLHDILRCDPGVPLQRREYFGSITTLRPNTMGPEDSRRIYDALGLDLIADERGNMPEDSLVILRHTLMNPFMIDSENDVSYIEGYFDFLERNIDALLDTNNSRPMTVLVTP